MTLTRRRFLTISAAVLAAGPAAAETARWSGVALGADASVVLHGPGGEAALAEVLEIVRAVEGVFSLFDPGSAVSRLNRDGRLAPVPAMLREVLEASALVHGATGGAFDPTVQAVWEGMRAGEDRRHLVGWEQVRWDDAVTLGPGQALTFNGIAQGYATDLAAEALRRRGFGKALVNIGEYRGLGGPWRLELSDPDLGPLGMRSVTDGAIATSSPGAMRLPGGMSHIIGPKGARPLWSTVSVEADSAALADALSTAFCLMPEAAIREAMARVGGIRRVTLVSTEGRLVTLG